MSAANDNGPETPADDAPTGRPCPNCGRPALQVYKPFCSKRCADIDLHRWLGGVYAIPARPEEDDDSASETDP